MHAALLSCCHDFRVRFPWVPHHVGGPEPRVAGEPPAAVAVAVPVVPAGHSHCAAGCSGGRGTATLVVNTKHKPSPSCQGMSKQKARPSRGCSFQRVSVHQGHEVHVYCCPHGRASLRTVRRSEAFCSPKIAPICQASVVCKGGFPLAFNQTAGSSDVCAVFCLGCSGRM